MLTESCSVASIHGRKAVREEQGTSCGTHVTFGQGGEKRNLASRRFCADEDCAASILPIIIIIIIRHSV